MKLVRNLFFLFTITIFAVVSALLSIFNYSPFKASNSVFIDFYLSILIGLSGMIAIAVFYGKIKLSGSQTNAKFFWPSARQGLIISLGFTTLLFLQGLRILDLLTGISTVIVLVLLELFFQTKKGAK